MTLLTFIKNRFQKRQEGENSKTLSELSKKFDPNNRRLYMGNLLLPFLERIPRLECADGFSLSAQVGFTERCIPRDTVGPWSHIEVGFPSSYEPLLDPYGHDGEVYNYVPIEVLVMIIDMHGGLKCTEVINEGITIDGEYYVQEEVNPLDGLFKKRITN